MTVSRASTKMSVVLNTVSRVFKGYVTLLDDSLQGFKDIFLLSQIVARVLRLLPRFS